MSKKPKSENKKLGDKLDALWSKLVKQKAHYCCEYCGRNKFTVQLHSHHVFGRRNRTTRWDIDNGVCLCASCHKLSSRFSAHETPTEFTDWIKKHRSKRWYNNLLAKAHKIWDKDYKLAEDDLKFVQSELNKGIF